MDKKSLGNAFGFDGSFYGIMEKVFDIMALSFLFLLGCLPVITIGAACSALYYAASKAIRLDEKTVGAAFWHAYKENLKDSVIIWLIAFGGIFVFLLNIGILDEKMNNNIGIGLMIFYTICFVAVLGMACYAFPVLSRFQEPAGWVIKLALYLMVKHLPVTILLLAMLAGCYVGIFYMPYLALVLPGAFTLCSTYLLEPILQKHSPSTTLEH